MQMIKTIKKLYEEATALDKAGDDEKSNGKWVAIDKILDPYYKANKEILISASKISISGKIYLQSNNKYISGLSKQSLNNDLGINPFLI